VATANYRCYFLNGERIATVEAIACDDDAAARKQTRYLPPLTIYQWRSGQVRAWLGS
jgi:hypothetical protein